MSGDVRTWLNELGLGKYAEAFQASDVNLRALPLLTEADLRELGVSLGHRKILLAAIADLFSEPQRPKLQEDAPSPIALPEGNSPEGDIVPPLSTQEAERRLLTILFCDLVGSTALSQNLDPEDIREILRRYQDAVAGSVTRYGGHVAK